MRTVQVSVVVPGPAGEVADLWLEPSRWRSWIDGFGAVARLTDDWPERGAVLDWDSRPGGRGRVRERVLEHEPGRRLHLEVEDEQLSGTQTTTYREGEQGVLVELALTYGLKEANALMPIVDVLYIRRAMRASLQRTVDRFAAERLADAELS